MMITVRLFASCAETVGEEHTTVSLAEPATVAALRAALEQVLPQTIQPLVARSVIAINAEYADDEHVIAKGDEVALIPPVAGG